MAFTIASLRASGEILVHDCNNVATSFPNFVDLAEQVGIQINRETMGD
jgi:3-phosphoshikimate 1-carboxyvinyltransferase